MDPLAEKYYSWSPYNYVANNPLKYIDPDGRDIRFSYEYEKDEDGNYVVNKNGGHNLMGVTMTVTGKVIDLSGGVNMNKAVANISSQIESTFFGEIGEGISFKTVTNLSAAGSMDDISDTDHIFALVDMSSYNGNRPNGVVNQLGGMVAFVDADYFRGPWDTSFGNTGQRTAAHEFGHLAGLSHTTSLKSNIMQQNVGNRFYIPNTGIASQQLRSIYDNRALLNRGANNESVVIPSPSSTSGYINRSYPNRWGGAINYVKYR